MNDEKKRLEKMFEKFYHLKDIDKEYNVFGAEYHKYEFGKILEESVIYEFEKKYNVILPYEYKLFMLEAGNGGAGPFFGIVPFEKCLFSDIDRPDENCLLNPSIEFPHTNEWNMDFDNEKTIEEAEKDYFDNKHITGAIRICNFGCGHCISLVINGREYSHIWSDDRASDYGIYPFNYYTFKGKERLSFFDWYEGWLDQSIEEIKKLS